MFEGYNFISVDIMVRTTKNYNNTTQRLIKMIPAEPYLKNKGRMYGKLQVEQNGS